MYFVFHFLRVNTADLQYFSHCGNVCENLFNPVSMIKLIDFYCFWHIAKSNLQRFQ